MWLWNSNWCCSWIHFRLGTFALCLLLIFPKHNSSLCWFSGLWLNFAHIILSGQLTCLWLSGIYGETSSKLLVLVGLFLIHIGCVKVQHVECVDVTSNMRCKQRHADMVTCVKTHPNLETYCLLFNLLPLIWELNPICSNRTLFVVGRSKRKCM